jgi:hypothetical protein
MVQNTMKTKYIWTTTVEDRLVRLNSQRRERQCAVILSNMLPELLGFGILSGKKPTKGRRWFVKGREDYLAMVAASTKLR